MARVVKEQQYAARRNEILDSAQRLVYTKGFAQMSIQDILDDLEMSKGAFYHYFSSKEVLLEALIERLIEAGIDLFTPIVEDPHLSATEKLQHYFATATRWKTARKDYLLALLRGWYTDDNALVRQKMVVETARCISPMLITVVHQGIQEGVFTTPFPEHVGDIIISLMLGMGEKVAMLILALSDSETPALEDMQQIVRMADTYSDALERVLGAPAGSLKFFDADILQEWGAHPKRSLNEHETLSSPGLA